MRSEFDFIHNIKKTYGLSRVGDDCAVLPKDAGLDMVITADLLVEEIDFRLEWTSAEMLGHKALAVSLSDIAAMGAEPKWAMLSVGVPGNVWSSDFLERFYEGWFGLAKEFGVELIGGDVSRTPDKIVIDSILGGEVAAGKAAMRSGAVPGHSIYVSGSVGGAGGGLKQLAEGRRFQDSSGPMKQLLARQLMPAPRVELARDLASGRVVSAMIDLSDGLSSDLAHICRASNAGARIYAERIPVDPNLSGFLSPEAALDLALNGGEDFELLFTSPDKDLSGIGGTGVTLIGEITPDAGKIKLVRDGKAEILKPKGFRHF